MWADELNFPDLADNVAVEARLALQLSDEIKDLDERISAQPVEPTPLGSGSRFLRSARSCRHKSLPVRSYAGLVPGLDSSGLTSHYGGRTKSGDDCLRQAQFIASQRAPRSDPTLAANYHRLMTASGKHHNSARCHIATTLLTLTAAFWRCEGLRQ